MKYFVGMMVYFINLIPLFFYINDYYFEHIIIIYYLLNIFILLFFLTFGIKNTINFDILIMMPSLFSTIGYLIFFIILNQWIYAFLFLMWAAFLCFYKKGFSFERNSFKELDVMLFSFSFSLCIVFLIYFIDLNNKLILFMIYSIFSIIVGLDITSRIKNIFYYFLSSQIIFIVLFIYDFISFNRINENYLILIFTGLIFLNFFVIQNGWRTKTENI